jgi:hypothetical protein
MADNVKKPMAPYKKETMKDVAFAKGGDTAMFGHQEAGSQKAGGTAHKVGSGDQGSADPRGNDSVRGDKYASGGTTKMFGYTGSLPATSGITSAR